MIEEVLSFGAREYWLFALVLAFARGMDFLSTWIATPNLILEANPLARRLGWKWSGLLNIAMCLGFATIPLAAIVISTSSILVAARNFQSACLIRAMGEFDYGGWYLERVASLPLRLHLLCLAGQSLLFIVVGIALMLFTSELIPFGVGLGMIAYGLAVIFFTVASRWRS